MGLRESCLHHSLADLRTGLRTSHGDHLIETYRYYFYVQIDPVEQWTAHLA